MRDLEVFYIARWHDDVNRLPTAEDACRLEDLFACSQTGRLFPLFLARAQVVKPEYISPKTFHCPVCNAILRIGPHHEKPVASCTSCPWTTDDCGITAIPEMLAREIEPLPELTAAFDNMLRSIVAEVSKPNDIPTSPGRRKKCTGGILGELQRDEDDLGAYPIPRDRLSGDGNSKLHLLRTFMEDIKASNVLSYNERLACDQWERSKLPPYRRKSIRSSVIYSPYTREIVGPGVRATSATKTINAASFLPRAEVKVSYMAETNEIVLTLRNPLNISVSVALENVNDKFAEREVEFAWNSVPALELPKHGACQIVMLMKRNATSPCDKNCSLYILAKITIAGHDNDLNDSAVTSINNLSPWEYIIVVEIPALPIKLC